MRIIKLQSTKRDCIDHTTDNFQNVRRLNEMNVLEVGGCVVYFSDYSSAGQAVGEADVEHDLGC